MRINGSIAAIVMLAALIFMFGPIARATPIQHRGIFVYSTLCHGEEGDGGEEFVVMLLASGPMVTYEYTEGAKMTPLLASGPDVKINYGTGKVLFRFSLLDSPTGKPEMIEFSGTITDERLTLKRQGQSEIHLPRIIREKEKIPTC